MLGSWRSCGLPEVGARRANPGVPAARGVLQAGQLGGSEPTPPLADRVHMHTLVRGGRRVGLPGGRGQHNPRPQPVAVGPRTDRARAVNTAPSLSDKTICHGLLIST